MLIIVFVSLVPRFNVANFIFIMSLFYWTAIARLIGRKHWPNGQSITFCFTNAWLSELEIILFQVLPNLSSIIIVNMTLNLAGNIGIKTGLSYLGFGLPESVPSLGTLISYSTNPDVMQNKWWVWLPAAILDSVLMLLLFCWSGAEKGSRRKTTTWLSIIEKGRKRLEKEQILFHYSFSNSWPVIGCLRQ